jgi:hypothetical protein
MLVATAVGVAIYQWVPFWPAERVFQPTSTSGGQSDGCPILCPQSEYKAANELDAFIARRPVDCSPVSLTA